MQRYYKKITCQELTKAYFILPQRLILPVFALEEDGAGLEANQRMPTVPFNIEHSGFTVGIQGYYTVSEDARCRLMGITVPGSKALSILCDKSSGLFRKSMFLRSRGLSLAFVENQLTTNPKVYILRIPSTSCGTNGPCLHSKMTLDSRASSLCHTFLGMSMP